MFKCFKDYVAKKRIILILNLYCDIGKEYISTEFKGLCLCKGITYHLTVSYTPPQQNGVAECMNRT